MVYIGNLNYKMSEHDVKKLFCEYGYVVSAKLVQKEDGLNSGIAFVQMGEKEQVTKAIKELNGKIVQNRTLKVSVANDRFAGSERPERKKSKKEEEKEKENKLEKEIALKKKKFVPLVGLAVLKKYQKEKAKLMRSAN